MQNFNYCWNCFVFHLGHKDLRFILFKPLSGVHNQCSAPRINSLISRIYKCRHKWNVNPMIDSSQRFRQFSTEEKRQCTSTVLTNLWRNDDALFGPGAQFTLLLLISLWHWPRLSGHCPYF